VNRTVIASRKPVWLALAIALVIHTGLISLQGISTQGRRRLDTSFVRVWILDTLAPVEKLADRSFFGVGYIWNNYFALIGVNAENERLKRENDSLRMQITQQQEEILEAQRVRKLTGLEDNRLGKPLIARVIGRGPARDQTITIDKGTTHGVKPDTAVMTPQGIVGRVIHSSNFFSIVQLIVDSQSAIGVMLQSNRHQGILKGTGRDLELDYIADDNELKEGDIFLTSGEERIYPKGFPVGVITSVGTRRGLFKTVQIRISADLGRLEEVLCITDRRDNVDDVDTNQGLTNP
jgi:rod shape-determining protein MreC